jgi:L-asparagine transporter-like permease
MQSLTKRMKVTIGSMVVVYFAIVLFHFGFDRLQPKESQDEGIRWMLVVLPFIIWITYLHFQVFLLIATFSKLKERAASGENDTLG